MKKADTASAPEAAKAEDPSAAADAAAEAPKVNFKLLSYVQSFGIVMPTCARWSWFFLLCASIVLHCTCTSFCTVVFMQLNSIDGALQEHARGGACVCACVRAWEFCGNWCELVELMYACACICIAEEEGEEGSCPRACRKRSTSSCYISMSLSADP